MTIGIEKISYHIATALIDNVEHGKALNATKEFIYNKIGIKKIARKSDAEKASDLGYEAASKLLTTHPGLRDKVECLVFVSQNSDFNGLPHASAILHTKLALKKECAVFDISLGCSGYVHGLTIIRAFMESQGYTNGILVTSDPYSEIINDNDRDTSLLFGDAASATWLKDGSVWEICSADFGTVPGSYENLMIDDTGYLKMNGRAVFNFAAQNVPNSISNVLERSNLSMDDIDKILLHQGSRYIVETLGKRIGCDCDVPFIASGYGNTVSSSIPILFADKVDDLDNTIIISGFGVGLSYATAILTRNKRYANK